MGEASIPTKISEKNVYFRQVVPYLETNETRLGYPHQKIVEARALLGDPLAPVAHTWVYVFDKWIDEYNSRTPAVIDELDKIGKLLGGKLVSIYNNIQFDIWNENDRKMFRRKTGLPKAKPVHHITPVKEQVFFSVTPKTEGKFAFVCRTSHDSNSASIIDEADGIEVAYGFFPCEYKKDEKTGELAVLPKKLAENVSQCPFRQTFFKARFTLNPEGDRTGKYINFYLRWVNTKHPELNGPWCGPAAFDFLP